MKGAEMKAIRERLGLTPLQLAREIGYTGTDRNDDARVREYERDKKQIPLYIARLVWLLGGIKANGLAVSADTIMLWPHWPGYEFEHTPDAPLDVSYKGYTR